MAERIHAFTLSRRSVLTLAALIGLLGALRSFHASSQKSPTYDETAYVEIAQGFAERNDLSIIVEHPPLIALFFAVPYALGSDDNALMRLRLWNSLLLVPAAVLGAMLVLPMVGGPGALSVAALFSLEPTLAAHVGLATTDGLFAVLSLWALYLALRFLKHPSVRGVALLGVVWGLAAMTKFTALPLLLGVGLVPMLLSQAEREGLTAFLRANHARAIGAFVAGTLLVVWISLLCNWSNLQVMARSWETFQEHNTRGHWSYFLGETSWGGNSAYFPVAIALKTPFAYLPLIAMGLWASHRTGKAREILQMMMPGLTLLVLAMLLSKINIGVRHVLPAILILMLPVACLFQFNVRGRSVFIALALVVAFAVESVSAHPNYIPFFNLLAGGSAGGGRYLGDSNLDWGQDLTTLQGEMEKRDLSRVSLSYFGSADISEYVKDTVPYEEITEGWIAVSRSHLQGLRSVNDYEILDWLLGVRPVASPGHSINLYHIQRDSVLSELQKFVHTCDAEKRGRMEYALARVAEVFSRPEDAVIAYRRAAQSGMTPTRSLMRAGLLAHYELEASKEAARDFEAVLDLNPDHYGARFQLAMALEASGSPEAHAAWQRADAMARAMNDEATVRLIGPHLAEQ